MRTDKAKRPLPVAREGPIGLDELPLLEGREVARQNADLLQMGRLIFVVGGVPVRFERSPGGAGGQPASTPAVWLGLSWSGQPLLAAVSPALADGMAQSLADVGVDQLGVSGIELFAQLMLSPLLPPGLILRQAALQYEALTQMPQGLEPLGIWRGRHGETGEASGHELALWADPDFPLSALLGACAVWASSRQASPLAGMPISLPVVAARWSVDAGALVDLAVGDVLILG